MFATGQQFMRCFYIVYMIIWLEPFDTVGYCLTTGDLLIKGILNTKSIRSIITERHTGKCNYIMLKSSLKPFNLWILLNLQHLNPQIRYLRAKNHLSSFDASRWPLVTLLAGSPCNTEAHYHEDFILSACSVILGYIPNVFWTLGMFVIFR